MFIDNKLLFLTIPITLFSFKYSETHTLLFAGIIFINIYRFFLLCFTFCHYFIMFSVFLFKLLRVLLLTIVIITWLCSHCDMSRVCSKKQGKHSSVRKLFMNENMYRY